MSNLNPDPGQTIATMLGGHIVKARVLVISSNDGGSLTFDCEFLAHHPTGSTRLCVDFGSGWNIAAGETFRCKRSDIACAAKLMAQDHTEGVL